MKRTALSSIQVLIVFLLTGLALAQNLFIYPAEGRAPNSRKGMNSNATSGPPIRPASIPPTLRPGD
jgi:hypothetical protein